MLSRPEKDLINQIMVESGPVSDCVMAVFVRRVLHLRKPSIFDDIPSYSALMINTGNEVRGYIGNKWKLYQKSDK